MELRVEEQPAMMPMLGLRVHSTSPWAGLALLLGLACAARSVWSASQLCSTPLTWPAPEGGSGTLACMPPLKAH